MLGASVEISYLGRKSVVQGESVELGGRGRAQVRIPVVDHESNLPRPVEQRDRDDLEVVQLVGRQVDAQIMRAQRIRLDAVGEPL